MNALDVIYKNFNICVNNQFSFKKVWISKILTETKVEKAKFHKNDILDTLNSFGHVQNQSKKVLNKSVQNCPVMTLVSDRLPEQSFLNSFPSSFWSWAFYVDERERTQISAHLWLLYESPKYNSQTRPTISFFFKIR